MARTPIKTYRDLVVWDKAINLAVTVHEWCEARRGPRYFALINQLQRIDAAIDTAFGPCRCRALLTFS